MVLVFATLILSYKFYLSGSAGLAIPYQDIAGDKKNSAAISVGLGMSEYDNFSVGANFNFFPSLNLFSLLADIGLRFDSESFSASILGALGPSLVFREKKNYANLALSSGLKVGTYIVPLRLVGFINPSFSAHLGPMGGYIISIIAGLELFASR
ncbi:MAG: hypothetical protein NZ927_03875 [Candidatus Calescibacterium sp.]|nr:hypothetical protein [Candidatus Calescibacterium sp.]MCX7734302.1 hypothetical protein [bacterium]MDW8087134.1 hypothetical protein [Candidatus Calescibacterium sp.]